MACAGRRSHYVLVGHTEWPHHELVVLHLQANSKLDIPGAVLQCAA